LELVDARQIAALPLRLEHAPHRLRVRLVAALRVTIAPRVERHRDALERPVVDRLMAVVAFLFPHALADDRESGKDAVELEVAVLARAIPFGTLARVEALVLECNQRLSIRQ